MPNHSQILDASDLHYAKARLFTGSPTEITPDFAGQILVDGLSRMFVGGSKSTGDLIQVAGNVNTGDGTTGNIIFGNGEPSFTPAFIGLQFVDIDTRDIYFSLHTNSPNGWIRNRFLPKFGIQFTNNSNLPITAIAALRLYYVDLLNPNIPHPDTLNPYQFDNVIWENTNPQSIMAWVDESGATFNTAPVDFTALFNTYGKGAYVFSCEIIEGNQVNNYYLFQTLSEDPDRGLLQYLNSDFSFSNPLELRTKLPNGVGCAVLNVFRDDSTISEVSLENEV